MPKFHVTILEEFSLVVDAEDEDDARDLIDGGYVLYEAEHLDYRKVKITKTEEENNGI